MKVRHVKISNPAERSFQLTREIVPHFYNPLHFHNKIELTYIAQSYGTAFIGDYIGNFKSGELFLIGERLPHDFKNGPEFFDKNSELKAEAVVIHFNYDFLGSEFWLSPEMAEIATMLKQSKKGFKIKGKTKEQIKDMMLNMHLLSPTSQVLSIIQILEIIQKSNEIEFLSTTLPTSKFNYSDAEKLDKVINYAMSHFKQKISLETIAELANMNPSAFCRFFKTRTKRSFTQFLIELRLEHAIKLMMTSKQTIEQISHESGFDSISYFHRTFKKYKGVTPLNYQRKLNSSRV